MVDESMFQDIQEIAENSAYLKAVEEKDVCLDMINNIPPYEQVKDIEMRLHADGLLTFDHIFAQPTGYYMLKCFLAADYAVDKAIFIKDVQAYRRIRFPSARRRIAKLIYQRFVSQDPEDLGHSEAMKGCSVFELHDSTRCSSSERTMRSKRHNHHQGLGAAGSGGGGSSTTTASASRRRSTTHSEQLTRKLSNVVENTFLSTSPSLNHSVGSVSVNNESSENSALQIGNNNNSVGVYGTGVRRVKDKINHGLAPVELFDEVAGEVLSDLKLDAFPRFRSSEFYKKFIRTKWIETQPVKISDFCTLRVLGRGGFGTVHACRKKDSGAIYAMKCIKKKLVKVKSALDNVMEERNVLTMLTSKFVTNLKYALQDDDTLYLIMDLMLGGDLKYHLINAGHFTEKQARFYAAEVLLGLESLHKLSIIYRDLKLENVLLDDKGHCRLSDMGLCMITKVKIKGYAGTPGYTAPEMVRNKLYGRGADIFSFGVLLYRMLCGAKPFKGKVDRDLDRAVVEKKPSFPRDVFSPDAISLLTGLLAKRPEQRLGCGPNGIEEVKDHPFFEPIDWGLLEAGYIDPPFIPDKLSIASIKDIGDFDMAKYRHIRLDDEFRRRIADFNFISARALQEEAVTVLKKADENKNFEKFALPLEEKSRAESSVPSGPTSSGPCCTLL